MLLPILNIYIEVIEQVCKMLTFCVSVNFPTFILGDSNLPCIDWGIPVSHGRPNHQAFVKFCISNSLTQVIDYPLTVMEIFWIFYSATTSVSTVYYRIMLVLLCAVLVFIPPFIFV